MIPGVVQEVCSLSFSGHFLETRAGPHILTVYLHDDTGLVPAVVMSRSTHSAGRDLQVTLYKGKSPHYVIPMSR
jgi:hypothetical protein